jgi:hypothetical protein
MWNAMLLSVAFGLAADLGTAERTAGAASQPTIQAARPPCNSENLGLMWPAPANDDAQLAKRLAREGELEICRWGPWRYNWASPTVHIRQLIEIAKKRKRLN